MPPIRLVLAPHTASEAKDMVSRTRVLMGELGAVRPEVTILDGGLRGTVLDTLSDELARTNRKMWRLRRIFVGDLPSEAQWLAAGGRELDPDALLVVVGRERASRPDTMALTLTLCGLRAELGGITTGPCGSPCGSGCARSFLRSGAVFKAGPLAAAGGFADGESCVLDRLRMIGYDTITLPRADPPQPRRGRCMRSLALGAGAHA